MLSLLTHTCPPGFGSYMHYRVYIPMIRCDGVTTHKQRVSRQRVTTFVWRPGWQYDVSATASADSVLTSDCRAQFGRPSTRGDAAFVWQYSCRSGRVERQCTGNLKYLLQMRIPPFVNPPLQPARCRGDHLSNDSDEVAVRTRYQRAKCLRSIPEHLLRSILVWEVVLA